MSIRHKDGWVHFQQALENVCATSDSTTNEHADAGMPSSFCRNPAEYDWRYIGKQDMLVPYNCIEAEEPGRPVQPYPKILRWEKHGVWIVEGTLKRGESNIMPRRRFYIDDDSWMILLGEGYNADGIIMKCYMLYKHPASTRNGQGRWYSI